MPDSPTGWPGKPAFDLLYNELRELARRQFRRERPGHTLQPTAIVHEAYLKMAQSPPDGWQSRSQFLAFAARAMRQVLVDHARARKAEKRGGSWKAVTLDDQIGQEASAGLDVLAVDEALASLWVKSERSARVAEMRLFAGMTSAEMAESLQVSVRTVDADWAYARLWLRRALDAAP